jgi:hypothetical protein
VDASWITNTCAIRLSRTLNYSNSPVPHGFAGLNTVSGADGRWYGFRVTEMRRYLEGHYGRPTVTADGGEVGRSAVAGKRGIIAFAVTGWSDATGHLDLWDGAMCKHAEYFAVAKQVCLWVCP